MTFQKIALSLFGILLIAGGLYLYFEAPKVGPRNAYNDFVNAIVSKDWERTWDLLSYESKSRYEEDVFKPFLATVGAIPENKRDLIHPELRMSITQIMAMKPYDLFKINMQDSQLRNNILTDLAPDKYTVQSVAVENNTAVLTMTGDKRKVTMLKEEGKWRILLFKKQTK